MTQTEESHRLEDIAQHSRYGAGVNRDTIHHSFRIFRRFSRPGSILEMGPAEGIMTDLLAELGQPLHLVEGADHFCEDLRRRHPTASVVHSLFEDYAPPEVRFENIILGHVLEHVEDPVAILSKARAWLADGGLLFAAVPNSRSLHRQAAVIMGLLPFEEELNESDHYHGHRRVYNPESFRRDFLEAGLEIEVFGGYWLKPMSNGQIERDWSPEMLQAFMALGERYPDIAGEIYIVARSQSGSARS
jgi:2-polyprenyl-3-methyl-5-hydroxy-6-metoxy-1,4-benzoquinol methylase